MNVNKVFEVGFKLKCKLYSL